MAELRALVAVVQTIVVSVTLPALLDAAVVLAGILPGLALGRGHVGGVGFAGDIIDIQDLIVSAATGPAVRNSEAQTAAAAIVNSTHIGALLLVCIIHSDLKDRRPLVAEERDRLGDLVQFVDAAAPVFIPKEKLLVMA